MKVTPATVFGNHAPKAAPTDEVAAASSVSAEQEQLPEKAERASERVQELGNKELPIADYHEQIVDAVDSSQAVVITAETGAGKSTQVPQMLAEAGYRVVMTQPRVVAARSVAERIQDEITEKMGDDFRDFVGYRTARERGDSPDNQILVVTDGLQLVRELSGSGVSEKQVLALDEVHEWNENMEVLAAWAKHRMQEDENFKVVVMSATMETGKLARYFAEDKRDVPTVEVPGRTYEVKKSEGGSVTAKAIEFARAGKNTLVFVPGKGEIDQVVKSIENAQIHNATVLPLHGQMEKGEQRKVFQSYDGVKIVVATNVAETSITIDDIDAVVDSGLERQNEVRNGVEGLYLRPISQANCLQRAGRAGRTKEGEYVLAQLDGQRFVPMAGRDAYGTPEILRTRLDGMVLRLAKAELDAEELDFYHQPNKNEITAAKSRLQKLGALDEDGSITKIGRAMERMPVESHYARMMVEARKYKDPELQTQLAALLAVQEVGGICQFGTRNKPCDERWRSLITSREKDSDPIKQLEVFIAAQKMSNKERRDHDIYGKDFSRATDVLRQLRRAEKLPQQELAVPGDEQRQQLVKCIIAGMVDNLYTRQDSEFYDADGNYCELNNRSIISASKFIVGTPFDLQITTRRGPMTLHLIESVTNVPSVEVLREIAPQLFRDKYLGLTLGDDHKVYDSFEEQFNGSSVGTRHEMAAPSEERRQFIAQRLADAQGYKLTYSVNSEIKELRSKSGVNIPLISGADACARILEVLGVNDEFDDFDISTVRPFELSEIVPPEIVQDIRERSPEEWGNLDLRYRDGVPYIMCPKEELLNLPTELRLPDGREIAYGDDSGWSLCLRPLSEIVQQEKGKARKQELHGELNGRLKELNEASEYELYGLSAVKDDVDKIIRQALWAIDRGYDIHTCEEEIAKASAKFYELTAKLEEVKTAAASVGRQITEPITAREAEEVVRRAEKERSQRQIEERGYPDSFRFYYKTDGATGNSQAFVINAAGELVPSDSDSSRYSGRYGRGEEKWSNIQPGTVILTHRKEFTAADHECDVVCTPKEGLSAKQLEAIREIHREIEQRWSGRRGMSGKTSPSIGEGWGFTEEDLSEAAQAVRDEALNSRPMDDMLAALQARFNG